MGTSTTYTENELVSLLKSRDSRAFGYLYDNYSASLYAVIAQLVDDMEIANDVLQEVFINIWRKIESYDPVKGRLFTWMLNIARNASIDTLRSKSFQNTQKNQPLQEKNEWIERGKTTSVDIDSIGLKKVVNRLKKEYRVLIDLAYFRGYTHEEIAEIENIPLGTVKTRIRSALIQLRDYLK
ncbi:MAG: sigma-70 family RNA polymerase sigma factor [Chitinophagaceae bacterium]|nr:sigma-70 family RNA polymerase sigma factor [Chitinophagaceae bacterium]